MTMTNLGKRVPNPPRTCIFCGGRPISKEHIYADWMAEFLRPGGRTDHLVSTFMPQVNGGVEFFRLGKGAQDRNGDHRSKGLKVVCKLCNETWMSRMQTDAKSALLPYLQSHPYVPNRGQQRALAAWAVMFSMIFDRADLPTAAVDQRQRTQFMKLKKPPQHWLVWIGSFDGSGDAPAWHRGLTLVNHLHGETAVPNQMNAQMTLGGAGGFFFMTVSTTQQWIAEMHFNNLRARAYQLGLLRVWPSVGFQQLLPKQIYRIEFEYLTHAMTEVLL